MKKEREKSLANVTIGKADEGHTYTCARERKEGKRSSLSRHQQCRWRYPRLYHLLPYCNRGLRPTWKADQSCLNC